MAFYMKMGSKSLKASGINMGTPLYNCGGKNQPPCPPSQEAADKDAEKNLLNAGERKEKTIRTEKKIPGGKQIIFKTNYSKKADGESSGPQSEDWEGDLKKMGFTGTVEEMNKAYNATRNSSRTETKTRTILDPIKLNPYGIKPMPMKIEVDPVSFTPRYAPVGMPEAEKKTGLVGSSTTIKTKKQGYTEQKNLRSTRGRKKSDICGGKNCG